MENRGCRMLGILVYLTALVFTLNCSPALAQHLEAVINPQTNEEQSQIYIVLTNKPPAETEMSLQSWYRSFLPTTITTTTSSSQQPPQLIHEYRNVVNGFAARLTAGQVKAMEDREGFVSAQPESIFSFHTTHTPNFLGLLDDQGLGFWNQSNYGRGVIIGVVDGGVLPDHPSFNDEGVPPPPAKWKGKCEFNSTLCNNKLIGARNVQKSSTGEPPIDDRGHGCHTASTAAGNFVKGANVFGNANGTAAGVAPYAHLAIYKACSEACSESDVLAAIDVAIDDGVDVISISLGPASTNLRPFYNDLIAIGLFAATQKGIFVSCSAGNNGPNKKTVSNEAPWILTVGASTTDRTIKATARLGNGAEYDGQSTFQPKDFNPTLLPLVYAGSNGNQSSALCEKGSLVNVDVKGKIVLCERGGKLSRIGKGEEVGSAGGVAMILMNQEAQGYSTLSDNHVLPATHVDYDSGLKIKAYINSTNDPKATILFRGTVIENDQSLAPAVASLSSRGPSKASPGILKPDIIGPGVSILAAWPFSVDNSTASISTKSTFNIISGTSMACPHLSGIAALLKSSHPDWSPAVIKSAIMTTADVVNLAGNPIVDETLSPADLFATGAGHVNPSKANDPGLVYDLQSDDYIPYLCGLKYTNRQVETIIKRKVNCSEVKSIAETQLNYPSFSLVLGPDERQSFTRTVTNVGEANSTYTLEVSVPRGIGMEVRPNELVFTSVNQKATYTVDFIAQSGAGSEEFGEGYLKWVSGKYSVRSPISVNFLMKFEPISAL